MLSGHAQYAKGYVEEMIGNVTGSKEWQESGKNDAEAGTTEMKVFLQSSSLIEILEGRKVFVHSNVFEGEKGVFGCDITGLSNKDIDGKSSE